MRGGRHDEQPTPGGAGRGAGRGPARAGDGGRHGSARRGAADGRGCRMRGRAGPRPHRGSRRTGQARRFRRRSTRPPHGPARPPGCRGVRASSWRSPASLHPRRGDTPWRWEPSTWSRCRRRNSGWSRRWRKSRRAVAATARCSPSSVVEAGGPRCFAVATAVRAARSGARCSSTAIRWAAGWTSSSARRTRTVCAGGGRHGRGPGAGERPARPCPHRSWTVGAGWPSSPCDRSPHGPSRPRCRRSSAPGGGPATRWSVTCPATPPRPRSWRSASRRRPGRAGGRAVLRRGGAGGRRGGQRRRAVRRAGRPRPRTGRLPLEEVATALGLPGRGHACGEGLGARSNGQRTRARRAAAGDRGHVGAGRCQTWPGGGHRRPADAGDGITGCALVGAAVSGRPDARRPGAGPARRRRRTTYADAMACRSPPRPAAWRRTSTCSPRCGCCGRSSPAPAPRRVAARPAHDRRPRERWRDGLDRPGAGLERAAVRLPDEAAVRRLAQRLALAAGRRLDDASPCVDGWLAGAGVRVHAVLAPVAADGTCLSLRPSMAHDLTALRSGAPTPRRLCGRCSPHRLRSRLRRHGHQAGRGVAQRPAGRGRSAGGSSWSKTARSCVPGARTSSGSWRAPRTSKGRAVCAARPGPPRPADAAGPAGRG